MQASQVIHSNTLYRANRVLLAFLLIVTTWSFVWHAELHMSAETVEALTGGEITSRFTNGFVSNDTTQVYHVWMYLNFIITLLAAFVLVIT